jgi:hypothetical protein
VSWFGIPNNGGANCLAARQLSTAGPAAPEVSLLLGANYEKRRRDIRRLRATLTSFR